MLRLCISKCGAELPLCGTPDERGNLCEDVDGRESAPRLRVPEVDLAVIAATASGEQGRLPGREGERFHGRGVRKGADLRAGWVGQDVLFGTGAVAGGAEAGSGRGVAVADMGIDG